jgi:hypothetical protein
MKTAAGAAIALGLALAGCQHFGLPAASEATPQPAAARPMVPPADPLLAFVVAASPGQMTTLDEPGRGPVMVRLEREYYSADGISCRRFTVMRGSDIETRVACRGAAGWQLDPVLGNAAPR